MSETPVWECCPGKQCGGAFRRRDFLKGTAAAAGALGLTAFSNPSARAEESLVAWKAALRDTGARRLYSGDELTHIAFPLGGIGAGQVYLAGSGELVSWQIQNNFNTEAAVDGAHFGVWAKQEGLPPQARLLTGRNDAPAATLPPAAFTGEYPLASIEYEAPGAAWPLKVALEAFNPMIPLNAKDSGIPAAIFRFRLENTGGAPLQAAMLATAPNLVGWDGAGQLTGPRHVEFSGNYTEVEQGAEATHLHLRTTPGQTHGFARPFTLVTNQHAIGFHFRLCEGVMVKLDPHLSVPASGEAVFWCGDAREGLSAETLKNVLGAVKQGATLVISGGAGNLLHALVGRGASGVEVFENWEHGYGDWELTGDVFRDKPATGPINDQQPVSGFRGKSFVDTYFPNDDTKGVARSRRFLIKKRYIHLLAGGGNYAGETCVNLLVGGSVVRSVTGNNTEQLQPVAWDVREFLGQEARIEIVDARAGGWGHVLADEILFSDSPSGAFVDAALRDVLREALPFQDGSVAFVQEDAGVENAPTLHHTLAELHPNAWWRIEGTQLRPGGEVWLKARDGAPLLIAGKHGAGRIVLCCGAPESWAKGFDIKTALGAIIEHATGNTYAPQTGWSSDSPLFGSLCLSSYSPNTTVCPQWDTFNTVWAEFAGTGQLTAQALPPSAPGKTWNAALSVAVDLAPGASTEVLLALSWHFPNRTRSQHYAWGPGPLQFDHRLGNHYNNYFTSALGVAHYLQRELPRLERETRKFHEAFYSTMLPRYLLDAVTANAAITRSPVYVWIEDGTIGGFEGTDNCCPMNCTHVYNYAMSMAHLFPALERNVRETDLLVQMHPERHFIPHRTVLPLSLPRLGDEIGGPHHHALDGELGTILKLYREWRLHGDRAWLEKMWPNAKLVMEHVLKDHDTDGNGVLRDLQANTYDTHLYGSNTFIGTLYLGALRATEELARLMDDAAFATTCRARFDSGSAGYDKICWNGEYYVNVFNSHETDPGVYNQNNCYGPGCFSDQLLGQFWAHLMGLGELLPRARVQQALQAMFKYNWRATLTDHKHQQRIFAEGEEKGLLVGSWPKGGRPERPILYCDEVWTGIEYQVATTMFYQGMIEEALAIVRGARDRYTGNQRNPWSEIECGGHYARAMSSYGLLLAAAGFEYDAASKAIGIDPKLNRENFKTFFTTGTAWGTIAYREKGEKRVLRISVDYGALELREVRLPSLCEGQKPKHLHAADLNLRAEQRGDRWVLTLERPAALGAAQALELRYSV